MNLRKIEISGFKSFMSRLELDFSPGITAIIGPNGCGKSNIVDSIRWVLGEQRTRLLRNTKMENVLFNGTRLRKPLGMAEVYMTVTNEDHSLDVDFEEVVIGRRLYRSGVSDYLVNGRPARLKEIRGLLVDTGLGNNAYSIIERDMVERVLSEKEQDKRHLLEEAAGVMRYRIQREEAERKIKATEHDLVRLVDILSELEKELRSLKYQMGKARRYTRLKEEADILETVLLKSTLHGLLSSRDHLTKEREEHEGIRLTDDNEIAIRENRLQEVRVEAAECEHNLAELRERRYAVSSNLQQNEERIAVHTERIASSKARIVEDDSEVNRAQERLVDIGEELDEGRATLEQKRAALETLREELAGEARALEDAQRKLGNARDVLRERKQLALDLVKEKAKESGALEHIEATVISLAEKQDLVETQLDELSSEEAKRVEELSAIETRAAEEHQRQTGLQNDLTRLTESLDRIGEQSAKCDSEYTEANRHHAQLTEKREFLDRIKEEHTRWSDETLGRYSGLSGVLADFVRVEKQYRKCFEACLMPVLRSVVASSRDDAVSALRELHDGQAARVQILFPDQFTLREPVQAQEGVIASAADLLDCDDNVADYLREYLSGVAVVQDVDAALSVMSQGNCQRAVTLDGVFFDGPGRIIVAGSDEIEMTILEYETKLSELDASLAQTHARVEKASERRTELAAERETIQKEIGEIRAALADTSQRYDRLAESRRETELHLVRVKEKITSLEEAIEETRHLIRTARERLELVRNARKEKDIPDDIAEADLGELENMTVTLEREKDAMAEAVAKRRLEEVALTGELHTAEARIRNTEKLQEELNSLIRAREEDAEKCSEQIRLSEQDVVALREDIARMHADKDIIEKEIDGMGEHYEALKTSRDSLETQLKEIKDQRDAKRENIERVNVEMSAVRTRIDGLLEKAQENFEQDLSPYVEDPGKFDPSEWENFDRAELDDVRKKLDSIGPVNMLAMEEHDEKEERFNFLSKQKDDLEEAKNSLTQAIRRINKEARRLLSETFDQVRTNFKETFTTLFDGGEADLMWADSDDPLEANIRIVASPKGKRVQEISNLSSGERALVALSLLFGIYLVKPSPFCVFDEVDAPLDDANVGRFVRLLRSFTDHTQFIVITHNKKTMEAADNLYGVTMEEPGVSKLISVHLDDAERFKRRGTVGEAASQA